MKTTINLYAIFVFILVSGCSENNLLPSLENEVAIGEAKVAEVPFESNFDAMLTEVIEYVEGDHIRQVLEGQGFATHLGKINFKMEEVVDFTTFPWTAVAEAILTAANGDELKVVWQSSVNPLNFPILDVEGDGSIIGGTGRFTDCSGDVILRATFDESEGKGSGSLSGFLVKNK